jgi:hypothetical protein
LRGYDRLRRKLLLAREPLLRKRELGRLGLHHGVGLRLELRGMEQGSFYGGLQLGHDGAGSDTIAAANIDLGEHALALVRQLDDGICLDQTRGAAAPLIVFSIR